MVLINYLSAHPNLTLGDPAPATKLSECVYFSSHRFIYICSGVPVQLKTIFDRIS